MGRELARRCMVGSVALASLLALSPRAAAQQLSFDHYSSAQGLPQRQIIAMFQDSTGYLWFGTYGGVARYGLSSNTILDIDQDADGRLVVATASGGLCRLEGDRFDCIREEDGLADDRVVDLMVDREGVLWAATAGGITRLGRGRPRRFTEGLPSKSCTRLAQDAAGVVWAGTERGLARLDGDGFRPVAPAAGEPIRILLATPSGLLVGSPGRLRLLRGQSVVPVSPGGDLLDSTLTDAALGSAGRVWIASTDGAVRLGSGRTTRIRQSNGLVSGVVHRVLVDREANVWFATDAGASKLVPAPFRVHGPGEGLPHPFVRALAEDAAGRLWVGTREGAAYRRGPRFRAVTRADGLPSDRIYGMSGLPDGRMLIGTREGLALWDDGVVRSYGVEDGLPDVVVYSILAEADGSAWIGTRGGLVRWVDGALTAFRRHRVGPQRGGLTAARRGRGRLRPARRHRSLRRPELPRRVRPALPPPGRGTGPRLVRADARAQRPADRSAPRPLHAAGPGRLRLRRLERRERLLPLRRPRTFLADLVVSHRLRTAARGRARRRLPLAHPAPDAGKAPAGAARRRAHGRAGAQACRAPAGDRGAGPRRRVEAQARGGAAPEAEAGGRGPSGRRDRPRLQQPADGHPGPRQSAAEAAGSGLLAPGDPGDHAGRRPGGPPDRAAADLQPQAGRPENPLRPQRSGLGDGEHAAPRHR